jgi:hypothetical protein
MKQTFPIILLLFLITSCENFFDCIINVRPELPNKVFKRGTMNVFYSDELRAGIKNEPRDDDYDYYFEVYDDLPQGIEIYTEYNNIYFEGVPLENGTFTFTLFLSVDPPVTYDYETDRYDDPLCTDSTSKTYTIVIN